MSDRTNDRTPEPSTGPSSGPAAPPVTCEGFYPTNINAQSDGSRVIAANAKPCHDRVGGNTFGWCSCSDSIPRFVNLSAPYTTCDQKCQDAPAWYSSDVPPLTGTPSSREEQVAAMWRMEKLALALCAFVVGCGLLVFRIMDYHERRVGGERQLARLARAVAIAPTTQS